MERKRGGSIGYLVGYREEKGWKYWILSGVLRGRSTGYLQWDMERKRGGNINI